MLSDFERYLNNLRDSVIFDPKHRVKPLHLLKGIGRYLPQSVDIGAVSAELQEFAKSRYLFRQNITDFYACFQPLNQVDKTMLRDVLKNHIKKRSEWIRNVDRSFRDLLIQYASALGTRENIKLQKRIGCLTWVIVILTIILVILATVTTFLLVEESLRLLL